MTEASTSLAGSYVEIPIKGKLALITGATGGIGAATARLFAKRGVHLALHYFSQHEKAQALVAELTALGVRCVAFKTDLADFDAVRKLHADVVAQLGHPDILYNNAAMSGRILGIHAKIENVDIEDMEMCWRVNNGASFLLTQLCVPHMEEQGYGRLVFCSSIAAATGGVVGPHYASSKSAMHGVMHWIAKQYSRSGITCNAVAPALIANTEMFNAPTAAHRDLIPVGRFGQPEEIASIVELLVTNSYMTNKIVVADGGMLPSSLA
ncbi:putative short-chain dehydrogenase/reductase [Auriscalpium vulgare]|uniref:Short-chain dehydrogenase/reductase n=1 Tax=Auriscalpium vulgare TaxID=40419 RepID=A0ACB8S8D0_9AGAM|nr:putative short-chain dehydrogenase/reductase [Auriscalpium vulgare]